MSDYESNMQRKEQMARGAFKDHVSVLLWDHPDQNGRAHAVRAWRWGRPDTGNMASTIYAVPGRLIIAGDIADAVYERCTDMVMWAKGAIRDAGYVTEKVPHAFRKQVFSPELAKEHVRQAKVDWLDGREPESLVDADADLFDKFEEWLSLVGDEEEWPGIMQGMMEFRVTDDWYSPQDYDDNLCWAYWVLRTWLEKADPETLQPVASDVL